jgi:hypothetical protein
MRRICAAMPPRSALRAVDHSLLMCIERPSHLKHCKHRNALGETWGDVPTWLEQVPERHK